MSATSAARRPRGSWMSVSTARRFLPRVQYRQSVVHAHAAVRGKRCPVGFVEGRLEDVRHARATRDGGDRLSEVFGVLFAFEHARASDQDEPWAAEHDAVRDWNFTHRQRNRCRHSG